jgi:ribonuclease Z
MTPLFHPFLVNGPLGDPAVFIDIRFARRAILFDLGEITALTPRKILKISHVFVSHTHLDHFVGFDHLLRISLGRDKVIHLYGPPNFIDQVKHKLSAYTWNLVDNYIGSLHLIVAEVHPKEVRYARLSSSTAFAEDSPRRIDVFSEILHEEPSFRVRAAFLDHKIPSLAFSLEERSHLNILKTELERMGLEKGPWLRELKEAIWREDRDDLMIQVSGQETGALKEKSLPLKALQASLVRITAGQKIAYVADTIFNEETRKAMGQLAAGADYLFMETAFLEKEAQRAKEKFHLTARQAGSIAAECGVKRLIPFHLSPKYSNDPDQVIGEALRTFRERARKKNLSNEE